MLILTRRIGERVFLLVNDEEIIIESIGIKGNQARWGFTAPGHIKIYREEIWEKIKQEDASSLTEKEDIDGKVATWSGNEECGDVKGNR